MGCICTNIDLIVDNNLKTVSCVEYNKTIFVNCTKDIIYFPGSRIDIPPLKIRPSGIVSDVVYKRIVTSNNDKFPLLKIRNISESINIPKFVNDDTVFIVPYIVALKEKRNDMYYPGGAIRIIRNDNGPDTIVYTTLEQ